MRQCREFEIAFVGLETGSHVYEYRIEDKFFITYDEQDFEDCIANIKLSLEKNAGFLQLKFDIDGTLKVACDRCGNTLPMQLWDEFNIIVKMVDDPEVMNEQEEDPDVYYISRGESHLHLADWIYEFINLQVPYKVVHPDDENGQPTCNPEVLKKLKELQADTNKKTDNADPRWDALKNLYNKN